jgi:predicted F0F1-ATPase subunit
MRNRRNEKMYGNDRKGLLDKKSRHSLGVGYIKYGITGFIIAIPAIIGAVVGDYIDPPHKNTWTLSLLVAGFLLGFLSAFLWVRKEIKHDRRIET